MPFIHISVTNDLSADQKRELIERSSQALVDAIQAPVANVRVLLNEVPAEHYLAAGKWGARALMYRVEFIKGRTEEQKAALIAALYREGSAVTGVALDEVRVVLIDVPNTDIGMAGGITAKQAGR